MKALLVICAALIGSALAGNKCCSQEDRREVQQFWSSVWGAQYSGRRVIIAQEVFQHLFHDHPDAKALFTGVGVADLESAEFKAHCVRVINGLDLAINLLDDPATLHEALSHLAEQHKAREGVKADHFKYIGKAFSEVMPAAASCYNPKAWESCFSYIAGEISKPLP